MEDDGPLGFYSWSPSGSGLGSLAIPYPPYSPLQRVGYTKSLFLFYVLFIRIHDLVLDVVTRCQHP